MSKLNGKVAVVTGASKGIGASVAEHLAAEGAAVIVNYASDKNGAEKVVGRIQAKGGQAFSVQADVSKPADIQRLFSEANAKFGRVDILVNNAGVYEFQPLETITPEHFHKQFDLNVLGLILATQEAVKHVGQDGGSIINISSIVSEQPLGTAAVYSATKAAVDAVTSALAQELGPRKIRVNSINPGLVDTEGTQGMGEGFTAFRQQVQSRTPLGRVANPEDIAKAVVFFASDDAGWVTGEALIVAGGYRQ